MKRLITGFQLSVARYFETRNPGIPGIINKLDRPGIRKLEKARVFWTRFFRINLCSVFIRASQ